MVNMMKRIKKATFLLVRHLAYASNRLRLYYWAEMKLYDLRQVAVMPKFYYRFIFHLSMKLVRKKLFRRIADRAIHTIPYHIRFSVA
jgi:hypothetical protein